MCTVSVYVYVIRFIAQLYTEHRCDLITYMQNMTENSHYNELQRPFSLSPSTSESNTDIGQVNAILLGACGFCILNFHCRVVCQLICDRKMA